MAIRARFKGTVDANGIAVEFLNGIPARDLSDEDYDALDSEQKRLVRSSSVYQMVDAKAAKEEAATPPKQEGGGV